MDNCPIKKEIYSLNNSLTFGKLVNYKRYLLDIEVYIRTAPFSLFFASLENTLQEIYAKSQGYCVQTLSLF